MAEVSNELIMAAIEGEDDVAHHTAYFTAAEGFMRGALLLPDVPDSAPALALLSGQILECLLKAFLSKVGLVTENELKNLAHNHSEQLWQRAETLGLVAGVTENELKKKFGHDLWKLWQCAETLGLPIGPIPEWATSLNSLHAGYWLRYPRNGLVFPNAQHMTLMTLELTTLLETVRERMG